MKTIERRFTVVLLTVVALTLSQPAWSQDSEDDMFVRELIRTMERIGWSTLETGQLERQMQVYRWERLQGVDPEIVAMALQYGRDRVENDLTYQQTARLAQHLAFAAREMGSFGFDSRDVVRAVMNETRIMMEQQWRLDEKSPELTEQTRDQIRQRIRSTEGDLLMEQLRTRTRSGNLKGPDSWPSPGPHGGTGNTDAPGPHEPGGGSGSGPGGGSGHGR